MISESVAFQRKFFLSGATLDADFRKSSILAVEKWISSNEDFISRALSEDFGKCAFESYETEIGLVLEQARYLRRNCSAFSRPQKVKSPLVHFPCSSFIYPEPYGVTLIMSPWNYPFQLAIIPLLGAIAAGNCAIVKPSAYSPAVSALIARMTRELFDPGFVLTVTGGRQQNQALLDQKFDYIFFTGSVDVGKTVMAAAAKNLTPFTLELGGKSPAVVCASSDVDLAAKRIVWGKFLNAGQTCVAPDYVFVDEKIHDVFTGLLVKYVRRFYGDDPSLSRDFARIISEKHAGRISSYIACGKVICGGDFDVARRYVSPTVLTDVSWDSAVMQEEIFGPVLPVMKFSSLRDVTDKLKNLPKPLALYLFTSKRCEEDFIMRGVSFGGGCINDTVIHAASGYLPFGGVGASGMGAYHGKKSFETFSHFKGCIKKSTFLDISLRYPPYTAKGLSWLKKFLR